MIVEDIVVLDFETTGLHPDRGDRVTEVAALRLRGGEIVSSFESLVNCRMRIPAYISKFTGITQAMVDAAPEAETVFEQLLRFIGGDAVIAHNAGFDQYVLDNECRKLGLTHRTADFICSLRIARRLFPDMKSHALGCLASRLQIPFTPGAHRAAVDASVTAKIMLRSCEILRTRFSMPRIDASTLRKLSHVESEVAVASAA